MITVIFLKCLRRETLNFAGLVSSRDLTQREKLSDCRWHGLQSARGDDRWEPKIESEWVSAGWKMTTSNGTEDEKTNRG